MFLRHLSDELQTLTSCSDDVVDDDDDDDVESAPVFALVSYLWSG